MSRFQTSFIQFISDGKAQTKLAILAFLCCGQFVKNSNVILQLTR